MHSHILPAAPQSRTFTKKPPGAGGAFAGDYSVITGASGALRPTEAMPFLALVLAL